MYGKKLRAAGCRFAVEFRETQVETDGGRNNKVGYFVQSNVLACGECSLLGEERMHLVVTRDFVGLAGRINAHVVRGNPASLNHSAPNHNTAGIVGQLLEKSGNFGRFRARTVPCREHFREQHDGTWVGTCRKSHLARLGEILRLCTG